MGAYYTTSCCAVYCSFCRLFARKRVWTSRRFSRHFKDADGIHKVQILDPAVGTGTFISDVIGKIYAQILKGKQGSLANLCA